MAPRTKPTLPNLEDDHVLTTRRAGEVAARATGHVGPYHPATVRGWVDKGLLADVDPHTGRHRFKWGDLKRFLGTLGLLAVATADPAAAATAGEAAASSDLAGAALVNPTRKSRGADEDEDEDTHQLETFHCPRCGRAFHVTPATLVAQCPYPRCGEEIDLGDVEDDEDDQDDDRDDDQDDDDDDDDRHEQLDEILDDLDRLTRAVRRLRRSDDEEDDDEDDDGDEDDDDDPTRHRRSHRHPNPVTAAGALSAAARRRVALRGASRFVR